MRRDINKFDECLKNSPKSEQNLVPADDTLKKPDYLWVADSPDSMSTPTQIPIQELEAKLGFQFSESLWVPLCFYNQTKNERTGSQDKFEVDYDAFMLVNMGSHGYGLASRKEIPAESFLFNYAGEYGSTSHPPQRGGAYAIGIRDNLLGLIANTRFPMGDPDDEILYNDFRAAGVVDAASIRNLAAFMQHAPGSTSSYYFSDQETEQNVALSNTTFTESLSDKQACQIGRILDPSLFATQRAMVGGFTCAAVVANTTIPANTLMWVDYGSNYWSAKEPELFDTQGKTIPYSKYCPKKLAPYFCKHIQMDSLNENAITSLPEEVLNRYSAARLQAHFKCFKAEYPKALLAYRTRRFLSRYPENNSDHQGQEIAHPKVSTKNLPDKLVARLQHFGFKFNGNSVDLVESVPKPSRMDMFI